MGKRKIKGESSAPGDRLKNKAKAGKKAEMIPNLPRLDPYFVFRKEFEKEFWKRDNKFGDTVMVAAGKKWDSMSAAEIATYEAKAKKKEKQLRRGYSLPYFAVEDELTLGAVYLVDEDDYDDYEEEEE